MGGSRSAAGGAGVSIHDVAERCIVRGVQAIPRVIGILALLYPRSYVDYGSSLAYTEGSDPDWQGWVYPGTRVIGLLYVLVALDELLG